MGRETPLDKLSDWTWDEVAEYPVSSHPPKSTSPSFSLHTTNLSSPQQMVWLNPGTNNRPHLQVHGCCVYKLTTKDPKTGKVTINEDVQSVRDICYAMQSKIYAAENIYAHRWQEGDLVIFHNKGVMHSITGQLGQRLGEEKAQRLLWQCTMGSTERPQAYRA